MQADIEKLLLSGVVSASAAEKLARLAPGTYVQHKSWGFGRIAAWDATLGSVTIDFLAKKSHPMQFQFAAETLQAMAESHFLARKVNDLASLKADAQNNPRGVLKHILDSLGGKATLLQIQQMLTPEIVANDVAFKTWWDKAKKAIKGDGHFVLPAKKTDPVEYRTEAISKSGTAFERWNSARQSKDQIAALDEILKSLDSLDDAPARVQPIIVAAALAAQKTQKLHATAALELLAVAEELAVATKTATPQPGIAAALRAMERDLVPVLSPLNATRLRQVLSHFPDAFGEEWPGRVAALIPRTTGPRLPAELSRALVERNEDEALRSAYDQSIRGHTVTCEMLYWLASERAETPASEFVGPELLSSILSALERDVTSEIKRSTRLREILTGDRDLIPDLVSGVEAHRVRGVARTLLHSTVFDDLTRKSLVARIIKVHPSIIELLSASSETRQEDGPLIVSWESLEKRKAEFDELVKVKIPQNIKDISIARSYGDLRENFEFKSAKQMQGVLQRQKRDYEAQLSNCRGTDFSDVDASQVSVGTVVRMRGPEGVEETYAILGAWDTDPDKGIVSYLAPSGQSLIGKHVGDTVQLNTGAHEILEITPYRPSGATASES